MSRMIFVNLPVADLERRGASYEAIGAVNEPKFTDDTAAMHDAERQHLVMLLTHDKFTQLHAAADRRRQRSSSRCCCAFPPTAAKGRLDHERGRSGRRQGRPAEKQDYGGSMYGRRVEDPDGHSGKSCGWTPRRRAGRRARSPRRAAQPRFKKERRYANQPQRGDRDHRLPMGPRFRQGRGPRPARALGAGGGRPGL